MSEPDSTSSTRLTRKIITLVAATAVATAALVAPVAAMVAQQFRDVPVDGVHAEAIAWLAGTGVTAGCDTGTFCPNDTVSRAQLASFLYRLSGADPDTDVTIDAATVQGLAAEDLKGAPGATGPRGPKGDTGDPGATGSQGPAGPSGGLAGFEIFTYTATFSSTTGTSGTPAICPDGKVVLGGGYRLSSAGAATVHNWQPRTGVDEGSGEQQDEYYVEYTPTADGSITVYATCASLDAPA